MWLELELLLLGGGGGGGGLFDDELEELSVGTMKRLACAEPVSAVSKAANVSARRPRGKREAFMGGGGWEPEFSEEVSRNT